MTFGDDVMVLEIKAERNLSRLPNSRTPTRRKDRFPDEESSSDIIHEATSLVACPYVLKLHAAEDLPKAVEMIMSDRSS